MVRSELITRLQAVRGYATETVIKQRLTQIIDDIEDEGVLDVQAPAEIAEKMRLPYRQVR